MSGRIVIFLMIVILFSSCEDPSTLSVSRAFSGNNIQTIYTDTFSVLTSTVQIDTFLTSGTGTVLLGSYQDPELGRVTSSSYFQIVPNPFAPDIRSIYDSALLIMEYNHTYSGDTTKFIKINGYQLTEPMVIRPQPVGSIKLSAFNYGSGFFSSSSFTHSSTPLFSGTLQLRNYNRTSSKSDTVWIRLPDNLGAQWFRVAQNDSAHVFSIPANFFNSFFYGLYLEPDPSSLSTVAGFNASTLKIRLYYKKFVGNYLTQTFQDFKINGVNNGYQFNNIKYDRSGTVLSSLQVGQGISSRLTNNITYLQAGTGLVTRLDFPSVKDFFANKPSYVLNAAFLEIDPIQGTYPKNLLPPPQLQLYVTDNTNIPLTTAGGSVSINYDLEYGLNTQYTFQLFSYLFGQIKSGTNFTSPLFLAAAGTQGNNVQRLYLADRFHPYTKIKLKIFYSYAPN